MIVVAGSPGVLHGQAFAPRRPKEEIKLAIPKGYMPPAGMCRIWIDDVPAGQQPAPTDCATAIKNRPTNGRVIFGDEDVRPRGKAEKKEGEKDVDAKRKPKKP